MNVEHNDNCTRTELRNSEREMGKRYQTVEEDNEEELEIAWDDVFGATLNPQKVREARKEEIKYVNKMRFYDKVPTNQCHERTGKALITIRWIDTNKGAQGSPNYRSRLVAREINIRKREDLFAATPLLEALNLLISMTATANRGENSMVNDISRASFTLRPRERFTWNYPSRTGSPEKSIYAEDLITRCTEPAMQHKIDMKKIPGNWSALVSRKGKRHRVYFTTWKGAFELMYTETSMYRQGSQNS